LSVASTSSSIDKDKDSDCLDPVFLHTRREALFIVAVWVACLVWTVGSSYLMGYNVGHESVATIAGIPAWVAWSVGVPWLLATIFTFWFCLAYMADDDLGEVDGECEDAVGPVRGPIDE